MKKIVILLCVLIVFTGCSSNADKQTQKEEIETENVTESNLEITKEEDKDTDISEIEPVLPRTFPEYLEGIFGQEEWTTPGLVHSDGSIYETPEENQVTGKRINVLDYGAKADDETYDNMESFNQAMETAQPGDEIYIPAGRYYFYDAAMNSNSYVAHIVLKEGVNIVGEGMDKTVLISVFDPNYNLNKKTVVLLAWSQSNIVIEGLSITSNTPDNRMPDPEVSNLNNVVETAPVYGIVLENDKPTKTHGNIVVRDVLVERFQRMAIRISMVRDVRVYDCTIQNATDLGGGGAGYGVAIQGMTNNVDLTGSNLDAVYNVVENCTFNGPYLRHGILIQYYAHNNLIKGNTIKNTLLDSIDLHGEDEYANEICNNTIMNPRKGAGIGVGNSGATHDKAGPYNYIHNNILEGGDRGMDVLYGSTYTVITENTIKDIGNSDGTGIFMQNANHTFVYGNTISDFIGEASKGIAVLYSYVALEPEIGVPDGIVIVGNTVSNMVTGVYIEAHTDHFTFEDNTVNNCTLVEVKNDNGSFVIPPISDVVIPKEGEVFFPSHDNFITNESRDAVQSQANMKFKSSFFDIPYNRMIYMKFDLVEAPVTKGKVYLRITSKSKDGLATINIWGTQSYNDWSESTITWENALYHQDQVAQIKDENGDLTFVNTFTYTTVGSEFNTYYIDVTEYIRAVGNNTITLILVNDLVENMYCEIYSKESSREDYRPALVYSYD